jgi:lysophospholipase L1-like esterase
MKRLVLFAAISLAACASAGTVSDVQSIPSATADELPSDAPFRDEILRFAQLDRESPPPACPVLFVGSSSIRLWSSLKEDMAPLPVLNRGFGGSTIAQSNMYFDRIVAPYRPRAIVFYAGENDLDAGQGPAAAALEFARFMNLKRSRLGSTPVFYISAKPSKARYAQLDRQTQLNDAIRRLAAASKDLTFVDVVTPMLPDGQPQDLYVEDGLHMNATGYAIWRELVRDALAKKKVERRNCR